MNITLDCYSNCNFTVAPKINIRPYPSLGKIEIDIEAADDQLIQAFLKSFNIYEILEEMTEKQKQELTNILFERYAVGEEVA